MRYQPYWPIVALAMFATDRAMADEPRAPERLRIATWNIAEATAAGILKPPVENKPVWRTTFGAERRTEVKPSFDPTNIDADVLLLQGVTNVRDLRRVLPARAWRVIFSRQILSAPNGIPPTTAIAVRLRKGMRIATQEHLLALAETTPETKATPAAGLAVRLVSHGRTVWVASAALDPGCTDAEARCPATQALADWVKGKSEAADQTVVVGGRLQRSAPTRAPEPLEQKPAPAPEVAEIKPPLVLPPLPSEKRDTSPSGWLTGWFGLSPPKAEPSKPDGRLGAEENQPAAPPASPAAKQPVPRPEVQSQKSADTSPVEGKVERRMERNGNRMKLVDTDAAAACPDATIMIQLAHDGHVKSADAGFAHEKTGCLVMVDLSVEPAPPPPPEAWPEIVEPTDDTTGSDNSTDDAG